MKAKVLVLALLVALLALGAPVFAQDDDESMDSMCDTEALATLFSDAAALAESGDLEALEELFEEIEDAVEACTADEMMEVDLSTPDGAIQAFIETIFTFEFENLAMFVCEDQRALLEAALPGMDELAGMQEMLDAAEFDFSGLEYEVTDETEDSAMVTVSGELTISIFGQEQVQSADDLFGASVQVVKEGDNWVICDENAVGAVGS